MIQELDSVVLTTDLPEYDLERGDIGAVVLVHGDGTGYEVEFVTLEGETVAVVSLFPSQIRPIGRREIARARLIQSAPQPGGTSMDALSLATSAVTILSPYLVKVGEKAAEEIGSLLPEGVGKVWTTIMAKFRGNVVAEAAVKDFAKRPDDQLSQSSFAHQLRNLLEAEPALATELARLLDDAKRQGGETISNTGSGAVATSGGVAAGAGGMAVGGNVGGNVSIGGSEKKG
jgi:hypothetical protein